MKLFSKTLAATALGASLMAAGPAIALAADPTPVSITGTPVLQLVSGGSFDDIYSFSVTSISDVTIGGSSSGFTINLGALPPINIPAVSFGGGYKFTSADGTRFHSSGSEYTNNSSSFSFMVSDLDPGTYLFEVKGTAGSGLTALSTMGSGLGMGAYAVVAASIPVAVPEPGEWAMMLAGLGMVGAMIRRRIGR